MPTIIGDTGAAHQTGGNNSPKSEFRDGIAAISAAPPMRRGIATAKCCARREMISVRRR
jgi:hypothetical protein